MRVELRPRRPGRTWQAFSSSAKRAGDGRERDRIVDSRRRCARRRCGSVPLGRLPSPGVAAAAAAEHRASGRTAIRTGRRAAGSRPPPARYCGPQLFCASATRMARRWPSRSGAGVALQRSRSAWMRSRLARICWILAVERAALRRLAAEQDEEAVAFAAGAPRLRLLAVELGLLAGGGLFELAGSGRRGPGSAGAAVEGLKLGFEPRADRILLRLRLAALAAGHAPAAAPRTAAAGMSAAAPGRSHRNPNSPRGFNARARDATLRPEWCPKFGRRAADAVKLRRI